MKSVSVSIRATSEVVVGAVDLFKVDIVIEMHTGDGVEEVGVTRV